MGEIRRRVRKRGEKKQDYLDSITQDQEKFSTREEEVQEESPSLLSRASIRQDQGTFTTALGISDLERRISRR